MTWLRHQLMDEGGGEDKSKSPGTAEETTEQKVARLEKELADSKKLAAGQQGELDNAKRYVAAMIAHMNKLSKQQEEKDGGKEDEEDPVTLIQKDPIVLLDAHFQNRMAPILDERMKADEAVLKSLARDKIGKDRWDKYAKEIEEFMAPLAPAFRAKPGAWEEAFKYIRANHLDEEVEARFKERVETERQATLEGSMPGATGRDGKRAITKEERAIMEEFGMGDDDWRKWRGDDASGADTMFRQTDAASIAKQIEGKGT